MAAEAMSFTVCVECSRLLLWGREVRWGSPVKKGKTHLCLREVTNVRSVAYLPFYMLIYIHLLSVLLSFRRNWSFYRFTSQKNVSV
jgi:hypothetical protein